MNIHIPFVSSIRQDKKRVMKMTSNQLLECNYKDLLQKEFLEEYEKGIDFFHQELVELNVIIYLAEKIIDFPVELFIPPPKSIFFPMVMYSFYDYAILIISRLVTDKKKDLYSLLHFKNRVRQAINEDFRKQFDRLIKESSFNKEVDKILGNIKDLRNNAIAHKTKNFLFNSLQLQRPNIDQLKIIRDKLDELIGVLAFNVELLMLPIPYLPIIQTQNDANNKTDIDEILDSIARNSTIINMPEKEPEIWKHYRMRLSSDILDLINKYRQKFTLPKA